MTDKNGKNTGSNAINRDVLRPIRWAGLEPSITMEGRDKKVTVYGFHSLRHSFASHCAEAGVPKAAVVSILGAASNIIDKYYTHVGDEAQMKAINAISFSDDNSTSPQQRIDQVLKLISEQEGLSPLLQQIESLLKNQS